MNRFFKQRKQLDVHQQIIHRSVEGRILKEVQAYIESSHMLISIELCSQFVLILNDSSLTSVSKTWLSSVSHELI